MSALSALTVLKKRIDWQRGKRRKEQKFTALRPESGARSTASGGQHQHRGSRPGLALALSLPWPALALAWYWPGPALVLAWPCLKLANGLSCVACLTKNSDPICLWRVARAGWSATQAAAVWFVCAGHYSSSIEPGSAAGLLLLTSEDQGTGGIQVQADCLVSSLGSDTKIKNYKIVDLGVDNAAHRSPRGTRFQWGVWPITAVIIWSFGGCLKFKLPMNILGFLTRLPPIPPCRPISNRFFILPSCSSGGSTYPELSAESIYCLLWTLHFIHNCFSCSELFYQPKQH